MTDAADLIRAEIETVSARIATLEAELCDARSRLPGLEHALILISGPPHRPTSTLVDDVASRRAYSGGRQPGSISKRWQRVYRALHRDHEPFTERDVVSVVAGLEERDMRAADARRMLSSHMEHGLVEEVGSDAFRVSDLAVSRYGFGAEEPEGESTPSDENGGAAQAAPPETGLGSVAAPLPDPHPQPSPEHGAQD